MELVKKKTPKTKETRLGVYSFICALTSLAYLNIFLIRMDDIGSLFHFFFMYLPLIGVGLALSSFIRIHYKKTFAWWALGIYAFMFLCIVAIFFFGMVINPKP
jgi:cell division protein FtsW (lipid II flippase)